MAKKQALVVIHGMGEQRPVETLNRFSRVITPEGMNFYSKVDRLTGSFEARRHLIPPQTGLGTQTEIYEYHWAHLMQGNKLADLFPLLRKMLLPVPGWWGAPFTLVAVTAAFLVVMSSMGPPEPTLPWGVGLALGVVALVGIVFIIRYVPVGLVVVWMLFWLGIGWVVWALSWGPLEGFVSGVEPDPIRALFGGGITALIVGFLVKEAMPRWLTSSFVDVVRYVDTSPRSYEARRQIRTGILALLQALHDYGRYDRVVILAHSLGSYIAYDAISHLWGDMAKLHAGPQLPKSQAGGTQGGIPPSGLQRLEEAASALTGDPSEVEEYQHAQRELWVGIRNAGNPWLITDFISFGSPMYFADRLYTRDGKEFRDRVEGHELPTCPPQNEQKDSNNINNTARFFSWNNGGRRVLHDAAPFAVVRWTNLWYPSGVGFFGDWFGGKLAPLFGMGIRDLPVTGNRPWRWIPGVAHALYLGFPDDRSEGSFTGLVAEAVDINAAGWLPESAQRPDSASARSDNQD